MTERKYLPTFAELCDRLSIVLLKQIFIPENRASYIAERELIEHDINLFLNKEADGNTGHDQLEAIDIRALMMLMLSNRYIWENEAAVRRGHPDPGQRLRMTHMINGVRNTAKNTIAYRMGQRVDLKIDCLASDLQEFFGENWDVFK